MEILLETGSDSSGPTSTYESFDPAAMSLTVTRIPKNSGIGFVMGWVHHLHVGQLVLQIGQLLHHLREALLGRVVLAVLPQVTVVARDPDLLLKHPPLVAQLLELRLQLDDAGFGEVSSHVRPGPPLRAGAPAPRCGS